jgi:hypothetical protein
MKIKYTDNKWVNGQARIIENKCRRAGRPYSTGISRELTSKAIIELRDCDDKGNCVVVLNVGQFELNKKAVLEKYLF